MCVSRFFCCCCCWLRRSSSSTVIGSVFFFLCYCWREGGESSLLETGAKADGIASTELFDRESSVFFPFLFLVVTTNTNHQNTRSQHGMRTALCQQFLFLLPLFPVNEEKKNDFFFLIVFTLCLKACLLFFCLFLL